MFKRWVLLAGLCAAALGQVPPPTSLPRLVKKLEYGDYGSKYHRFGDLDGDGMPDVLLVQAAAPGGEHKAILTCLTALTLDGKILWQVGKPDPKNIYFGSDFPVQIFDIDRDGRNEVIFIPDEKNVLTILEGATGKKLREVQLAGGHDSLLFADFSGQGYPFDLVVKDRYQSFWVYDRNFKLQWSKQNVNPGHYPLNFDFDGDGKDELLMGYTLYAPSGKELWSHPEFPLHNDAVYIEDVDGDGRAEIAIATSKDCVLLDAQGKILFRKQQDHCQHTQIGKFRPDIDGKQVFFVSRGNKPPGDAYRPSVAVLYDQKGRELWQTRENFWWMGSVRVDRWTAQPQPLIGLYSRGFDPPALLDGFGRTVAVFPFPPSITQPGAGPGGRDVYGDDYIQHFDCWGDEREEILVFNHKALYIYTNAAVWQKPRLYNNNYYPGRL